MSNVESTATRRAVLVGAAAVGAAGLLAACGSETAADTTADPTPDASDDATAEPTSDAGTELAAVADVPVGGGLIVAGVVVTQPTAGEFRGFSTRCTHQGCEVTKVADGAIVCPCHTSTFSVADGSVLGGPAPSALAEVAVVVDGDAVVRG